MINNKTIRQLVIADKLFPGSGGPIYEDRTATGAVATVDTNVALPLNSYVCEINPLQSGSGDPSPENERPITGFNTLTINRSTAATDRDFTISLGSTVYSARYDSTTGKLTITGVMIDLGELPWVSEDSLLTGLARAFVNNVTPSFKWGSILVCSKFKFNSTNAWNGLSNGDIALTNAEVFPILRIRWENWTSYTDEQIKTALSGTKLVYELDTPIEINITPTEIKTLIGEQTFSHDCNGNITVSFKYKTSETVTKDVKKWLPLFYPIRKGDF